MVVAIIVFIMGMFGWRFTFAPELENSWDAISAVATWVGAIGTTAAVFSAIYIAYQQSKISLFEKRYNCYIVIQKLLVCAEQMEHAQTNKDVQTTFRVYLAKPSEIDKNQSGTVFALELKQNETIVMSGGFLFDNYNVELLQKIINIGIELVMKTAVTDEKSAEKKLSIQAEEMKTKYCQLCEQYSNIYIKSMEKELRIIGIN